jgi:signal transduction histidine kinase
MRTWIRPTIAALGVALGGYAEWATFGWDKPLFWVPDLLVGLAFLAVGVLRPAGEDTVGTLALLTAGSWFVGTLLPIAVYWHRGPLIHLLMAHPRMRPRSRIGIAAVIVGYVTASANAVWANETLAVVLGCLLTIAAVVEHRRQRRRLLPAAAFAAAIVIGSAVPAEGTSTAVLLAYAAVLCGIAIGVAAGQPVSAGLADRVVELGGARSDTLRDALVRVLGDPSLHVGFWVEDRRGYLDAAGTEVRPDEWPSRRITIVDDAGAPFAVIVHDAAVLADADTVEAVRAAARLTGVHARLQAQVRALLGEIVASRRRLVIAGDEERRLLERRLHEGPRQRLEALLGELRPAARGRDHVARAVLQLERTLGQLDDLARGLHPRELADGLAGGLTALAARSPVPVCLAAPAERFATEVEIAVYYLCAEGLANAAKHAGSATVTIEVVRRDSALVATITDDGVGGADATRGSGLRGLTDRIEAIGGTLLIGAPIGAGTRLAAEIPIGAVA